MTSPALLYLCLGCLVKIVIGELRPHNVIFIPAHLRYKDRYPQGLSKDISKMSNDMATEPADGASTTVAQDDTEAPLTLKDLVVVSPVNAFVAAMTNLFGALLLALGSELVIVGRSVNAQSQHKVSMFQNDQQDKLLTMTLLMGSRGESKGCLQRAACEIPQRAKVYATSFTLLANIASTVRDYLKIEETDGHYSLISKVLRESSQRGNETGECSNLYPCKMWSFLINSSVRDSYTPGNVY